MSFQLPILVLITFLIAQIINCIADQFVLLGICRLIQTLSNQFETEKHKQTEDGEKYKNSIIRKKIRDFVNAGYLRIFPSFSNLASYSLALFNIFIGILMIIYFLALLMKAWRFWSDHSYGCLSTMFDSPRTYIYFGIAIAFNFFLIILFYFLSGRVKAQQNFYSKIYNQFRYDFSKLLSQTKPIEQENTILNINHSISRLRLFYIISDYNYILGMFCLVLVNLFLILFLLMNIFS